MKEKILTLLLITLVSMSAGERHTDPSNLQQDISEEEAQWVNSIYNSMTLDERIGQLFSIRAHSDKGQKHIDWVKKQIREYHVGGMTFFQGTPEKQAKLTNEYQSLSKIPLMIAVDAEWGLGMRFKKDGVSFPKQLTLGAIQDNRLLYEMGQEVARQCRRLGIHVNFAPVVDVNNNPNNPVINTRSFGEDRYNVAAKSYMYMKGMQDGNIIACAKHFPGHGDTDVDSHYDLPVITHDRSRLDSLELFPFRVLAQHGIQSMMIAHLNVPNIDDTQSLPTSLSPKAVTDLLKNEIGFEGLIFTDALEMDAVSERFEPGEVGAKSLMAGNDVLDLPDDIEQCVKAIKRYIKEGKLPESRIEESVKKVLRAKFRLGLKNYRPIKETNIRKELNTPKAYVLKRQLIQNAMTLVRNPDDLIPFRNLNQIKFASISLGAKSTTKFQRTLSFYKKMPHYVASKKPSATKQKQLLNAVKDRDIVIVSLHDLSSYASKGFGLTDEEKQFIETLRQTKKVILTHFGNPYALKYFDNVSWLLQAYGEDEINQEIAAQALFGAFAIDGRLPVTASAKSKFNQGVTTQSLLRLGLNIPEAVGMDSEKLAKIDGLVQEAINTRATPGGVILVAKEGKVVYNKAYGYHTYAKQRPVTLDDVYDLASITKIAASTLSVMRMYEDGEVNIYEPMSKYVPQLKGTNKENATIQDMMAHRAQLHPWIPFYEQTVSKRKRPLPKYYSSKRNATYSIPVAERMFMKESFTQEMWQQIYDSKLLSTRRYRY
ncbi:MAG: glycoside hydrolase family 3 N-terminal domain-containing protein, partial [Bacteroidota bacterium]